jgi:5-methylcytosine-specific restriction enzyme subunit McrC
LSYAWNKLDEKERVKVSLDDTASYVDLFAKVLINGTHVLLKRGIERSYVTETLEIPGVKGKLELTATLKEGLHLKQRTICSIDEFSYDIITNQILVATLFKLLKVKELDGKLKPEVKSIIRKLPNISLIELKKNDFKKVKYHRNNQFYSFLINVCELIYDNTLPSEDEGEWSFIDFTRDKRKMNQLFEAFILNYYKCEFPQWEVGSPHIKWQLDSVNKLEDLTFLPQMRTDVTIDKGTEKIIIDAKYYKETLASYHGSEKVISHNLYQLFSYLLNQRDGTLKTENATGMLLYPTTKDEHDLEYKYQDHIIQIKTVNLNRNWVLIEERLNDIVKSKDKAGIFFSSL